MLEAEVREPRDVAIARRAMTEMLAGVDPDLVDTVCLSVSELLTNAIIHGLPPVVILARIDGQTLRIEIGDGSPARGTPQQASATASGGRGLAIVDAVAHRWGIESRGGGKAVWLEYSLAPASATEETTVHLLGVPVHAYLRGQEHMESVVNELTVLASSDAAAFAAIEAVTVTPLRQAMVTFKGSRHQGRAEAEAAASAGHHHVDLVWRLPPGAAADALAWAASVRELDRLAEAGVLLTPPPDPEVSRLRQWLAGEIHDQLGSRPPAPFPPG